MMEDFYGIIYLVTNQVNGKIYIGQTTGDGPSRWKSQVRGARGGDQRLISRAVRKYGENAFKFGIIWFANNQAQLDRAEIYFIELLQALAPFGYNLRSGGAGGKHHELTKKKLKCTLALPEVREIRKQIMKEVCARPDVKFRMCLAQQKSRGAPQERKRQSTTSKEFHARPGFKEKHRSAVIAAVSQPAVKARHREAILLAFARPETKLRRSLAVRQLRWINNGAQNKRIKKSEPLPEGWSYGQIKHNLPLHMLKGYVQRELIHA